MITKTHGSTESAWRTAPVFALTRAVYQGEYVRFRGLLQEERARLLAHVGDQLPIAEAEECVESAIALAYRRFLERPAECTLMRWLVRLLHEAIRTRPCETTANADNHA